MMNIDFLLQVDLLDFSLQLHEMIFLIYFLSGKWWPLTSHPPSAQFISPNLFVSILPESSNTPHPSTAAILNTRLGHIQWTNPLGAQDKQQRGSSPMTNDDKWRHPDEMTARVCRWNKDKHAWGKTKWFEAAEDNCGRMSKTRCWDAARAWAEL